MPKKNIPEPIDIKYTTITVEKNTIDEDNIELVSSNNPYSISMYLQPDVEPKYLNKFIKSVERMVRSNKDYELYLAYLRDEQNLNRCAIFHNITSDNACIELHHFPFTLYTITAVTLSKMLNENLKVSTFTVADAVIKLHMQNSVGFVPLTTTMHELAHLGKVTLLKRMIYGNYMDIYNTFNDYLSKEEKDFIHTLNTQEALPIDSELILFLEQQGT